MTLINDCSNIECTLTSNKLFHTGILKLPPAPVEFLQISFQELSKTPEESWKNDLVYPFASSQLYNNSISSAKLLCAGDDVNTILEVELNNEYHEFQPGDTIGVLAENTSEEVDFIISRLNVSDIADKNITISSTKSNKAVPNFIPKCGSIRHILTSCLDIRCIPKKALLHCVSIHTHDPEEKLRLEQLASVQGKEDYSKFILEQNTSFLDILKSFSSCKPTIERLLEHLPRLMPRPYSISCSPLEGPKLKIVFSLAKYKNDSLGLCTGYLYKLAQRKLSIERTLENLSLNDENKIGFYFRRPTTFHLPNNNETPVIMIATGTGISPFLGFLNHRRKQIEMDLTLKFGKMFLYYGCRYSKRDFIYQKELNNLLEYKILSKMYLSFSRENEKQYVQDNLRLHKSEVFDLINCQKAAVYVCGNKKIMAVDVKKEILSILQSAGGMLENEATDYMNLLVQSQRYIEDVWH